MQISVCCLHVTNINIKIMIVLTFAITCKLLLSLSLSCTCIFKSYSDLAEDLNSTTKTSVHVLAFRILRDIIMFFS